MTHAIERIINAPAIFGWNKISKVMPTVIRKGFLGLLADYFRHEKTSLDKKSEKDLLILKAEIECQTEKSNVARH